MTVDPELFARPLRLNLGSGTHPTPEGWVAVDCVEQPYPVDVFADVRDLPFPDRSAERLYCGHLLEHVALAEIPALLAEFARVLAPDGVLGIVGPDIDRAVAQGEPHHILEAIVAKGGMGPGDHQWTCSAKIMQWLLESNGWEAEEVLVSTLTAPEWPNAAPNAKWQLAFLACPGSGCKAA